MITAVLLLAAGASTRMGHPKMLLSYQGKTLLQHIVDEAAILSHPVFVVTGAYHEAIQENLSPRNIRLLHNEHWQEGMGSSVCTGVKGIVQSGPEPGAIIIVVCDQPFITAGLLEQLAVTKTTSGKGMVACAYDDTIGSPVLFDKKYFPALQQLNGQQGAKKLLQQFPEDVAIVPFPQGSFDIDTPEDYERLKNLKI
jgi:molybdenum cofactor cytidylyltransferase